MRILQKSDSGKVIMVARSAGIAVSVLEPVWNASGRVMVNEWKCQASGLTFPDAVKLFDQLAA